MKDLYFYIIMFFFGLYFLNQSKSKKNIRKYKRNYTQDQAIEITRKCNKWGWIFIFFSLIAISISLTIRYAMIVSLGVKFPEALL